jgi:predicted nucleic acid-binding protein
MPAEVANILHRAELAGDISMETASLAHADLLDLSVDLFPYERFATRVWDLRLDLTAYDAWYVGLAEALEVNLATLDSRLARARGPHCRFVLPDR